MSQHEHAISPSNRVTRKVILVDDDSSFADSFRWVFEGDSELQWQGHYSNPVRFLSELQHIQFDLVLLDIEMPRLKGTDCVAEIKAFRPGAKILMLTVFEDDDLIMTSLVNGADGYLLKDSSPSDLLRSMKETLNGGAGISPLIARKIIHNIRDQENNDPNEGVRQRLSEFGLNQREQEVLRLLATGNRYEQIAIKLGISKNTVKTYVRHIYEKLDVDNRLAAMKKSGL